MSTSQTNLTRTVEVIEIPSGVVSALAEGTPVRIMQSRGDSYTVWTDYGQMYRIDGKDADAIGLQTNTGASEPQDTREFTDQMVWDVLKTVYDPEIPVNIVDLGLIYELAVKKGGIVFVEMTLTTPACPVAQSMPGEVERAASAVPGVNEVRVKLVWSPPWDRDRMTDEAKLELGLL